MHKSFSLILIVYISILVGCGPDDINNTRKRNGQWDWWVDSIGKGKWIPISAHPTWKNGRYIKFFNDGNIGEKGTIKNGEYVDTTFWFDRSGHIYGYKVHLKDSSFDNYVQNGPIKIYSLNGKIRMEGNIENHKTGGQWTDYYPNGRIERVLNLTNDTGWAVHYYETGQIKDSQFWINDNAFVVKLWNEKGILTQSTGWKNLHFDGEGLRYYENGNLWIRSNYSNGKVNGEATCYYLSGKIQKIYQFKDSLQDGRQIEYFENGQVQSDLFFKEGKMDGTQRNYDDKGKVTATAIYKKGVRIE